MLTQQAGWGLAPDYLAIFKAESYRWLVPSLKDPTQMSQMATTVGAVLLVAVVLCELLPAVRRNATWRTRIGFYFCGAIIYYISLSGVACVEMESMLRYEFCAARVNRAGICPFFASITPSATAGACIWHGGHWAPQCRRTQHPGLVRLEFYPGQLGSVGKT